MSIHTRLSKPNKFPTRHVRLNWTTILINHTTYNHIRNTNPKNPPLPQSRHFEGSLPLWLFSLSRVLLSSDSVPASASSFSQIPYFMKIKINIIMGLLSQHPLFC